MSRFLPRFCLSTFFTGSFGAECEIDRQKLCAGPTRVCPPTNGETQRKGRVCLFLGVLCCCYHVYLCGISSGSFCLLLLCVFVCVFFFSLLLVSHPETRQIENDRRSWKNKNDDNRPTKTTTAATGTRTTTAHRNKGGEREKPTTSNFLSKKNRGQHN